MDPKTIEATWMRFQAPDGTPIVISRLQEPHMLYLGAEGYAPSVEEITRFQDLVAQVNPQVFVKLATDKCPVEGVPVLNHKGRTLGFLTKMRPAFVTPMAVAPTPIQEIPTSVEKALLQEVPTAEMEVEVPAPAPPPPSLPPPPPSLPPPPHKVVVAAGKKKPAPTPKKTTSKRK